MTITEVKIYPFDTGEPDSSMRAYADVTLDQAILIKGFRVLASKNGGLFVGLPSKKGKDGKFYELVQFKNESLLFNLRSAVLEAYTVYTWYQSDDIFIVLYKKFLKLKNFFLSSDCKCERVLQARSFTARPGKLVW